jgi:hypothetical protein
MGMAAYFASVGRDTLDELKADPSQLVGFLFPDDVDAAPANTIDIDKAWHGIHFILCEIAKGGHASLAAAVLGGEQLGEDLGYGPPRLLSPSEVQEIAAALDTVTPEAFEASFDPRAMSAAEIYPDIWERDGRSALEILVHFFPNLAAFYRGAANRGDGAILWLA